MGKKEMVKHKKDKVTHANDKPVDTKEEVRAAASEHANVKPVDRKEESRATASAPPVNEDSAARSIQDACRNNNKQKQHKPAEDKLREEVRPVKLKKKKEIVKHKK